MPRLLGFDDDGSRPTLALEDLSDASWPPPWTDERAAAVLGALDAVSCTAPPERLSARVIDWGANWSDVETNPTPFLELGLCSPAWLHHNLFALVSAANAAPISGGSLVHLDVRSDNVCFRDGRAVLLDWNSAGVANADLDIAGWLPSLEGGGTLTIPATLATGVAGGIDEARTGVRLTGSNGYLSRASNATSNTTSVSMEAWIRTDTTPASTVVVAANGSAANGWGIGVDSAGKASGFTLSGSTFTTMPSPVTVADGAWHHLVLTRGASIWAMTVDGAAQTLTTNTTNSGTPAASFTIGALSDASRPFVGEVDEATNRQPSWRSTARRISSSVAPRRLACATRDVANSASRRSRSSSDSAGGASLTAVPPPRRVTTNPSPSRAA